MENDTLFEFMEKMYSEMKQGFGQVNAKIDNLDQRLTKVETKIDNIDQRLTKVETKAESIDDSLKQLAEVQQSHYEENQRNHKEIVEMLSQRLDNQDKAIKNLTIVK